MTALEEQLTRRGERVWCVGWKARGDDESCCVAFESGELAKQALAALMEEGWDAWAFPSRLHRRPPIDERAPVIELQADVERLSGAAC